MNGLKFIRTQCNISLSNLAMALGVSRQMISAWENDKKELPKKRVEQLSRYFGLEEKYFGEIDDAQKQEILGKAMFRWGKSEDEYYLYRCNSSDGKIVGQSVYFQTGERNILLSEEFQEKKRIQKEIVNQIDRQIGGPLQNSIEDQMSFINRGTAYYGYCLDDMNAVYSKPSVQKMCYYFRMLEVMKALSIAFDIECMPDEKCEDYTWAVDPDFVQECSELIKKHMKPMIDTFENLEKPSNKRCTKKDVQHEIRNPTVEEASDIARELMQEVPLGGEEKPQFGVYFPK